MTPDQPPCALERALDQELAHTNRTMVRLDQIQHTLNKLKATCQLMIARTQPEPQLKED